MERRQEAERQREAELQETLRRREAERQREVERQQQKERARTARLSAVKACVSIVRQQSDARLYKGLSRFDAYVTGEYGETYNYFGSADERFQFEKCMAERGVVLSKSTEKGKR
jgi:hypothetical protein